MGAARGVDSRDLSICNPLLNSASDALRTVCGQVRHRASQNMAAATREVGDGAGRRCHKGGCRTLEAIPQLLCCAGNMGRSRDEGRRGHNACLDP